MAVFVRMLGFFIIVPTLSSGNIPMQARIFLTLAFAILAFTGNMVELPAYDATFIGFAILLIMEFAIGLLIGLVVMIIFSLFHFVGQLMDFQMGFGMVNVFDPFTMTQTPITGNLYFLIISLFFVVSGAVAHVIRIMFQSFSEIAIGQGDILGNANLMRLFVDLVIYYFFFGIRVAMPMIGTIMIVNIVLGIMVKAIPQMNVFVVGMPLKVLVGLVIVYLTMPFLISAFDDVMVTVVNSIRSLIYAVAG